MNVIDIDTELPGLREKIESTAGRSNVIYTGVEEQMARLMLCEALSAFRSVEENLELARAQHNGVEGLRRERARANEHVCKLRTALAPHKHLPTEILTKIFVLCMEGKELNIPPDRHQRQVPYILGEVCSRWRVVSHAEPHLWRRLRFTSAKSTKALDQIIPRIGDSGMDLNFSKGGRDMETLITVVIYLYSHMIRGLKVLMDINFNRLLAVTKLRSTFKTLDSLTITVLSSVEDSYLTPKIITLFSTSESLRALNIKASGHYGRPFAFSRIGFDSTSLPWYRLNNLTIEHGFDLSFIHLLDILRWCPSLVGCRATVTGRTVLPAYTVIHTLENLRSLVIYVAHSTAGFGTFLTCLVCPALQELIFSSEYPANSLPEDELCHFVRQSPNLETLVTSLCMISEDGGQISEATRVAIREGILLPNLKTLFI